MLNRRNESKHDNQTDRASARIRLIVASLTLYNRANWAAVRRPASRFSRISARWLAVSLRRRPPTLPSARAAAKPAEVRSRIIARSNSAKAPTICIIMRPADVVVSIASVSDRKPAPAFSIFSKIWIRSFRERESRSSFQVTTTSPGRRWSIIRSNWGRSHLPPLAASSNTRPHPASFRARSCADVDCSSPFDTRAYPISIGGLSKTVVYARWWSFPNIEAPRLSKTSCVKLSYGKRFLQSFIQLRFVSSGVNFLPFRISSNSSHIGRSLEKVACQKE